MEGIDKFRQKIDAIDNQIIELLNERAVAAQGIGEIKKKNNLPIYVPERELAIYQKIESRNPGQMPTPIVKHIFREIISFTRSLEHPIRVSFLGPEGSYTHQAAFTHFGSSIRELGCRSIRDIFTEVEKDKADYGVAPIENSYEGVVFQTMDALIDSDLNIIGEIYLRIRHSLLSKEDSTNKISKIYGHPQSLAQARIYLDNNFPQIERIQVTSNSQAALLASQEEGAAAIASQIAADIYKMNVLAEGIEDVSDNTTRFIIFSKNTNEPQDNAVKTSLVFSISNRPGALHDILQSFSSRNIDLSKIESRPSKRKAWDYIFFIDFEESVNNARVQEALKEIKERTLFLKILGSYSIGGSF